MNGDLGKIYGAINEVKLDVREIKTRQEERHTENTNHLARIDKALGAGSNKQHSIDIKRLYIWVWGLAVGTPILLFAIIKAAGQ